ncbi:MAG: SDR family NAD(P)-dependent oxidoreductase, partial [Chloroflexi bacterium]|nr:SDR family NAD(P)-dependent oxidoreductase [Chloroflexota bacterium]
KRVIILGAETALGRECAQALAEAGATLALVASTVDADAAFSAQRLARRLGAAMSQAIDASNLMALRVMVRQIGKSLGGLDAFVDATGVATIQGIAEPLARREMDRTGGGVYVVADDAGAVVRAVAGDKA